MNEDNEIKENQFIQIKDDQINDFKFECNESNDNQLTNNESKDYELNDGQSKDKSIDNQLNDNKSKDNQLNDNKLNDELNVNQLKDNEIKELKCKLDKVIKENDNLNKFNNDLREQVKLLTGKLNLFQKLNTSSSSQKNSSKFNKSTIKDDHKDLVQESISKKIKITDLVTSIAQEQVSSNDYIYDPKIKAYLSKSTGWYFYQESNLFFDPKTNNYYSYDREKNTFTFHSNLDENNKKAKENDNNLKELKMKLEKLTKENENLRKLINNDCEDGEILSDSDSVEIIDEKKCDNKRKKQKLNNLIEDDNSLILPCVRLIVKKSTNDLDLGSLLIITVQGGSIGKSIDCDQVIDDETIDELHARIIFNNKDNLYYIEDLNSSNGTFINDDKIEKNKLIKIKHDQIIRLGDNLEFLAHIHDGYYTCEFCEPGCVQAKLRSVINQDSNNCIYDYTAISKEDKEKLRRGELKKIMKKFGINPYSDPINVNDNYKDRSGERRKEKGSSSENFKIEQTNFDKPIEQNNKGRKLLEKWGFKKEDLKDTKIIETKLKDDRKGLGFM